MCSHDCAPNAIYDHINVAAEGQPPEYEVVLKAKKKICRDRYYET
jgi:hypothetical protein